MKRLIGSRWAMLASMRPPATLLLVATLGCRGPGTEVTDEPDGPTTDTGTSDTHDGFRPAYFGVTSARFAIDDAGRASGFSSYTGGTLTEEPISVELSIGDGTVATEGFTTDNSCVISLVTDGPRSDAAWTASVDAWVAFEMPASATAFSSCGALDFPPSWGDPVDVVTSWTWGFGVGTLDPDVEQALRDSLGSDYDDLAPYVVGGGFYWDGLKTLTDPDLERWDDGWIDTGVTFAYEVDADLVQQPGPILIDAATIHSGDALARGLYDIQGTTLLNPASILVP